MLRRTFLGSPLLLAGCGSYPITTQEVKTNALAFESSSEILAVLDSFKADVQNGKPISEHDAFVRLRVNTRNVNIEVLRADTVLDLIYGRGFVSNDRELLRSEIARFRGVQIPFVRRKEQAVLSFPFHIESVESGYDLTLVLMFDKGQLTSANHFGIAVIDRYRRIILWNPFSTLGQSITNRTVVPQR